MTKLQLLLGGIALAATVTIVGGLTTASTPGSNGFRGTVRAANGEPLADAWVEARQVHHCAA